MARVKVKLADNIARVVFIESDATNGATLGSNLFLPSGVVATPATFASWLGASLSSGTANHRELAGLSLGNDHPQYTRKDTLTTRGDLYRRGASTVERVALGTLNQVLRSDGTDAVWYTPSANPTAALGLSAINGSANTFMRSDAAPALNQAIIPTWTGAHIFTAQTDFQALVRHGVKSGTSAPTHYDIEMPQANGFAGWGNLISMRSFGGTNGTTSVFVGVGVPPSLSLTASPTQTSAGSGLIGIGGGALGAATTASRCVAIGSGALRSVNTGSQAIAIGYEAISNTAAAATLSIAIGSQAMQLSTSAASSCIAIGALALQDAAGGSNIAIGTQAMLNLSTGASNTAIGTTAMGTGVVTGSSNLALGALSLRAVTSGASNVAIGASAAVSLTTGANNVCIGPSSFGSRTAGTANLVLGDTALGGSGTASYCTVIGASAASNHSADYTVAIGFAAMFGSASTTGPGNVAIGRGALTTAALGAAEYNVVIGYETGQAAAGNRNVLLGASVCKTLYAPAGHEFVVDSADTATPLVRSTFFAHANGAVFGVNGKIRALRDNDEIQAGAGSDLRMYHDGTDSTIENDTGNLLIKSGGDCLLSEGDIALQTVGKGLGIKEGTNARMGVVTLAAGAIVVNTTEVTANSRIFLTINGGTLTNVGALYVSARTAGTSFTITSLDILDVSDVAWMIVEPT